MPVYTDQLGRSLALPSPPQRIVSLVPSQTELLYDLGLEAETVGITKFCVHPEHWFRQKTRVGGTKMIKPEIIRQLQPDLIIANKEENVREQVEALAAEYPVWLSDIHRLPQALEMIRSVGEMTGKSEQAVSIIQEIESGFESLKRKESCLIGEMRDTDKGDRDTDKGGRECIPPNPLRTAYFIWKDPYMTAGNDTFIHDMLTRCGLENIFGYTTRYPAVSIAALQDGNCELLLLSSEPYPFREKHLHELQSLLTQTKIILVDGEMFSWYGSRLTHAPAYFQTLLTTLYS